MNSIDGKKPLLSICIPSYNRAELLRSTLLGLAPQIKGCKDEVELVVSDNCSVDNTRAVVDSFMESCPIRYHRNNENIGPGMNIALLISELAHGEYCWIIGDDDTIREGGVGKVVETLKAHPELDYFYVNYCVLIPSPRDNRNPSLDTYVEWTGLGNNDVRERRVDRWEQLLKEDLCCLSAIFSSVFRLSPCREALSSLHMGTPPTNLYAWYPHTVVLAKAMVGKPCWSIGSPLVTYGPTKSYVDSVFLVYLALQSLLDTLEELGVDPKYLRAHRRIFLRGTATLLAEVAQNPEARRPENFSFWDFLFRYFENGELAGLFVFLEVFEIRKGFREYPTISIIAICARPLVLLSRQFHILRRGRSGPRGRA